MVESGKSTDFYVTPSGDVVPATGYRYMDLGRADDVIMLGEQYAIYIGFAKYDSASQVKVMEDLVPLPVRMVR